MNSKFIYLLLLIASITVPDALAQGEGSEIMQKGRFTGMADGGMLVGKSNDVNSAPFIFHASVNYNILERLSAGLGAGAEFFNETYLPLTANVMYRLNTNRVVPYVSMQVGYMLTFDNIHYPYYSDSWSSSYYESRAKLVSKGGMMINPSLGVIIRLSRDFGIKLAAGYRHHEVKYQADTKEYYAQYTEYNRLSLTFGIIF